MVSSTANILETISERDARASGINVGVMHIRLDDLQGPEIAGLLTEHLEDMAAASPPESCHALDLDGLRQPGDHVLERVGRT